MAKVKLKDIETKIPLDDYLSSGKTIEKGQILYLQDIVSSYTGVSIIMKPYVYLQHNNKGVVSQKRFNYVNDDSRGIQSAPINCYFIEVKVKILK